MKTTAKLRELAANWFDAEWWKNTAYPHLRHRSYETYGNLYHRIRGRDLISIPDEDWDNLVILDACRYDFFEECSDLNGSLTARYSNAPQTPLFLKKNFAGRNFYDTVYVTGNPFQEQLLNDDDFHDVFHVWRSHWNNELKTVHPADLTSIALDAHERYPNKRIITHYMQPHAPFIGSWARENIGIYSGNEHVRQIVDTGTLDIEMNSPYGMLEVGDLSREKVQRGYRENLDIVLEYVEELLSAFSGKTVVSADHGELFGEIAWPYPWREYQHPRILATDLVRVPWLVIEDGERKEIKAEPPERDNKGTESATIETRLKHLGYK